MGTLLALQVFDHKQKQNSEKKLTFQTDGGARWKVRGSQELLQFILGENANV